MNENIKLTLKKMAKSEAELANLITTYLEEGQSADLTAIISSLANTKLAYGIISDLEDILTDSSDYSDLSDQDVGWRFVHVLYILMPYRVWSWVERRVWREEKDTFAQVWKNLETVDLPREKKLKGLCKLNDYYRSGKDISSLGNFVLSLSEDDLLILAKASFSRELMTLILKNRNDVFPQVLEALLFDCKEKYRAGFALTLLEEGGSNYFSTVFDIYNTLESILPKFRVIAAIAALDNSYQGEALAIAKTALSNDEWRFRYLDTSPAIFVARYAGLEAVDLLTHYVRNNGDESRKKLTVELAKSIGLYAVPFIKEIAGSIPHVAYGVWAAVDTEKQHTQEILEGFQTHINEKSRYWTECVTAGMAWAPDLVGPIAWPLLKDKSKVVREEAMDVLINQEGIVENAIELLNDTQAAARESGVNILLKKEIESTYSALREHVKKEKSKKIRNLILEGLGEEVPVEEVKEVSLDDKIKVVLKNKRNQLLLGLMRYS